MREAQLRQEAVVRDNWKVFILAALIVLMLMVLGYLVTDYCVNQHTYIVSPASPAPATIPDVSTAVPDGTLQLEIPGEHELLGPVWFT